MNIQFDPQNLIPIENIGTVYPNLRITDNWGILTVTNEALLSSDWQSIWISLPDNYTNQTETGNIKSNDWVLELKKGWSPGCASSRQGSNIGADKFSVWLCTDRGRLPLDCRLKNS
jgi:hypothetical protein